MALAILFLELYDGKGMTLTLLTALTPMKLISGFPRFYSLRSRHVTLFNSPISKKHWKDCWLFFGGRWLASDGPICGRVPSRFEENVEYSSIPLLLLLQLCCGSKSFVSSFVVLPSGVLPTSSESTKVLHKIQDIPISRRLPMLIATNER